jgi:hypothetical protein
MLYFTPSVVIDQVLNGNKTPIYVYLPTKYRGMMSVVAVKDKVRVCIALTKTSMYDITITIGALCFMEDNFRHESFPIVVVAMSKKGYVLYTQRYSNFKFLYCGLEFPNVPGIYDRHEFGRIDQVQVFKDNNRYVLKRCM